MKHPSWLFLAVLLLSVPVFCADLSVQGGGLTVALHAESGLPVRIDSIGGSGRAWLHAPASLEVTNVVTGAAASPERLHQDRTGFAGELGPLDLTIAHRWSAVVTALQWHLAFEGDAKRVEHRLVVDLPLLKRSDRIFTPSERGVMDVARHPSYRPPVYARYDWNGGEGYCLPLVSVLDPATDTALTVALPADANIPHLQVEWFEGGTLRLTLARRGMGGGRPSELTLLFLTHAADYRAALEAYCDLFPRYFEPVLPSGRNEGAFYYHHIHDHPDYEEMARQNIRYLWSSFWFTHLGEYLPEERTWHPYTYNKGWKLGQTMGDDRINAFIREMNDHGIATYAYFNVTEYGGYGGKEGTAEEAGRRLREVFADALMKTAEGDAIRTWEGAMAMNPGANYSLRPFLREQVRRHIERIPHFEGFAIDRLDWASGIDWAHSDGLTMIGDRPVENMALPVGDAVRDVCRMAHAAGKHVLVNQFWRVEVMRDTDGVCHESDPLPLLAYLTPRRPAAAWTQRVPYDGDLLRFEAQLKRRLHWAWFPHMIAHEFPISQQRANPRAADMLEIYAPLFEPLRGKRQVLAARCVTVDGANRANLYINGNGHTVVPVTSLTHFLSRRSSHVGPAAVTVDSARTGDLQWAHVYSADGPPYRARLDTRPGQATVFFERHGTSSVLVAGHGPEPKLLDRATEEIAATRTRLFPPVEGALETPSAHGAECSPPDGIEHYILTVKGEHVGSCDTMELRVNGKQVGALRGTQGRFRLPEKEYLAPRVELYAGDEGVWYVPKALGLLAVFSDGKIYRTASWTPKGPAGLDTRYTGRLWMKMRPCAPEEWTPPACTHAGKEVGTGGRWKESRGRGAAWIPPAREARPQNGYRLEVSRNPCPCRPRRRPGAFI